MTGVDIIIRNDFKLGMDAELYHANTIEKLKQSMPDKKIFYLPGTNLIAISDAETNDDWAFLILCSGFWLVDCGFPFEFLVTDDRHLIRNVAWKIARALCQDKVLYIDSRHLEFGWEIESYDRYLNISYEHLKQSIKDMQLTRYSAHTRTLNDPLYEIII